MLFLAPASRSNAAAAVRGFAFWPESLLSRPLAQSDVFVTVAAVLQQLRNADMGEGDALVTNWFQQTLLSPGNFGRYNDGIIQACLLRAARPTEVDFASDAALSREAGRIIRRIIAEPNRARGEAAAEFLIAVGCGRVRLKPADLDDLLQPMTGAPALVDELRLLGVKPRRCLNRCLPGGALMAAYESGVVGRCGAQGRPFAHNLSATFPHRKAGSTRGGA